MKMNKKAFVMGKTAGYILAIAVLVVGFIVIMKIRANIPESNACEDGFLKGTCFDTNGDKNFVCPYPLEEESLKLSSLCPKEQVCCIP